MRSGALLATFTPITLITSFIVQKTKSTWPDFIIHILINGLGFLLVAFGVVGSMAPTYFKTTDVLLDFIAILVTVASARVFS